MVIQRDAYLNKLIRKKNNGLIKVITGLRRCGKSYLLFHQFYDYLIQCGIHPENIIALSLDDDENASLRNPDELSAYLKSSIKSKDESYYVLLDEAQFAITEQEKKGQEPIRLYGILNGLLSKGNVDVYITGSNSKFLSSDVMTEFRGRGDEVKIYPLTFKEFCSAYPDKDVLEAWGEYSRYGGMPYLLSLQNDEDKEDYLDHLVNLTYIKDVVERYHLRGDVVLDALFSILSSSIGSLTNPTKLANTFKSHQIHTSDITISKEIGYLIDAFIISKAERYDIKGKRYIDSPYKYYFSDIGLRNSQLHYRQQEQTHIMENIIYNELVVRGFNVDVGVVERAEKGSDGRQKNLRREVDFVCNKGSDRYYIQSAYTLADEEKRKNELKALDSIDDSFRKIIVTQDFAKPWKTDKGYLVIHLFDFLLDENALNR